MLSTLRVPGLHVGAAFPCGSPSSPHSTPVASRITVPVTWVRRLAPQEMPSWGSGAGVGPEGRPGWQSLPGGNPTGSAGPQKAHSVQLLSHSGHHISDPSVNGVACPWAETCCCCSPEPSAQGSIQNPRLTVGQQQVLCWKETALCVDYTWARSTAARPE